MNKHTSSFNPPHLASPPPLSSRTTPQPPPRPQILPPLQSHHPPLPRKFLRQLTLRRLSLQRRRPHTRHLGIGLDVSGSSAGRIAVVADESAFDVEADFSEAGGVGVFGGGGCGWEGGVGRGWDVRVDC